MAAALIVNHFLQEEEKKKRMVGAPGFFALATGEQQELLCFGQFGGEPVEAFVQALSLCRTSRLDVPLPVP